MDNKTIQVQRQYPGETLAADIFAYVKSPAKLDEFIRHASLGVVFVREMRKEMRKGKSLHINFQDGVVGVRPETLRGKAVLAVVALIMQGRIKRIRQCQHCGSPFYARFERQRFCNDRNKKCQWTHYHSPEWRKQNRERNWKHQRAYRERLFGKQR